MNAHVIITAAGLFLAGLLAGEEFVVRYGVRDAIDSLDAHSHIVLRQALIRRLRVVVPAIYAPAMALAAAGTLLDPAQPGFVYRLTGLLALGAWTLATFGGTVPINAAALDWNPESPPANWRALVRRWEGLNTVRCWAAVLAFAAFLTSMTLQLAR
jgi:hypothetical protein